MPIRVYTHIVFLCVYEARVYSPSRHLRLPLWHYQGFIQGGGKTWDIPPKAFSPLKNPFSIDIIWHNYNKMCLFYNFYIWQGYAYALKKCPRINLRALLFKINSWGTYPQTPLGVESPPKPKILYESLTIYCHVYLCAGVTQRIDMLFLSHDIVHSMFSPFMCGHYL